MTHLIKVRVLVIVHLLIKNLVIKIKFHFGGEVVIMIGVALKLIHNAVVRLMIKNGPVQPVVNGIKNVLKIMNGILVVKIKNRNIKFDTS